MMGERRVMQEALFYGFSCPSSYDLRQIVPVRKGGSGSLVDEVMRPAADAASGDWRLFGV
jgi:hypothetical protein